MATEHPHPQDPAVKLAPKEAGAPAADDHGLSGPPSAETIKRGYEEDVYDTKTVLSVPLLVLLFFVLAFGTVTVLFTFFSKPTVDPNAHPQAKARNEKSLNERIGRIGRGKEVDTARLDQLDQRTGDARAIPRPKTTDGNSPQLHPEDLIPSKDRHPELFATDKERVGLDKTMVLEEDALKVLFKKQAVGVQLTPSDEMPSGANAGRSSPPKLPESKPEAAPKAPEPVPPPKTPDPVPPKGKEGKP